MAATCASPVDDVIASATRLSCAPAKRLPLDGRVFAGDSYVNQAPVTGESLPVEKGPGDEVFAGTINGRGALDVLVTRLRRDSTLARIIHLVERAQAQRAPSQAFVDRFARIYTPVVLVLAVRDRARAAALLAGASWSTWFYRSLVLLVISCPCALVISTPVSIVSALAAAARKGVLIKGGAHLEKMADDSLRGVRQDRHAHARPAPRGRRAAGGWREARRRCCSLRHRSKCVPSILSAGHRRARGVDRASGRWRSRPSRRLPGRGAEARLGSHALVVGSHRLFEERGLCSPEMEAALDALAARGSSAVMVAAGGTAIGVIGVADEPREAARDAVELLRETGYAARRPADRATRSPPRVRSPNRSIWTATAPDCCRRTRSTAVEELRARYGALAMVGDGVNDAPALAAADVGIAMGVAGTDAALETADVALMADELSKIPYALRLSRATARNIRANIAFSIVLKGAFLVLAVTGTATLWMAVAADMGASLVVIANALRRLLRES